MKVLEILTIAIVIFIFSYNSKASTLNLVGGFHSSGRPKDLASNDKEALVLNSGPEFGLEFEYKPLPVFSLFIAGYIDFGSGSAQYSYPNTQTSTTTTIDDLELKFWQLSLLAGLRARLSVFYAGAGGVFGSTTIIYDDTQMRNSVIDIAGNTSEDTASFSGYFAEIGMEFLSPLFNIRVFTRLMQLKTSNFETIENKKFDYSMLSAGVSFMIPL